MEDIKEKQQQADEKKRGDRGTVGKGTPGSRLKQRWQAEGRGLSLKQFVLSLLKNKKEESADAKLWHDNKRGKNNEKRSEANATQAKLIAAATKTTRRKKKNEGGGK